MLFLCVHLSLILVVFNEAANKRSKISMKYKLAIADVLIVPSIADNFKSFFKHHIGNFK